MHTAVEVKTIGPEDFKKLEAPLAEHRLRTNLYLRCIDESSDELRSHVRTDIAKVLYVSKGGYGCSDESVCKWGFRDQKYSPFKEFTITRNDADTQSYCDKALALKVFRDNPLPLAERPLPARICPNALVKRATYCPKMKDCFSEKFK